MRSSTALRATAAATATSTGKGMTIPLVFTSRHQPFRSRHYHSPTPSLLKPSSKYAITSLSPPSSRSRPIGLNRPSRSRYLTTTPAGKASQTSHAYAEDESATTTTTTSTVGGGETIPTIREFGGRGDVRGYKPTVGSETGTAGHAEIQSSPLTQTQTQKHTSPLERYNSLISRGLLQEDAHQREIINRLQRLHIDLETYMPVEIPETKAASGGGGVWGKLFGRRQKKEEHGVGSLESVPKGLYLYGDVGTGKTMLMDLFYDTLPPHLHAHRRRVHFHAFMLDVFRRVHAIKHGLSDPSTDQGSSTHTQRKQKAHDPMEGRSDNRVVGVERLKGGGLFAGLMGTDGKSSGRGQVMDEEDAIYEAARELAVEGRILCFDEFQVTDIVTAMILRQLLERMMAYGVVCITTSNRHPDELYKNGIQRSSFVPCIDLIKKRFDVVDLDSGTDYRRIPRALSKTYFSPLNDETRAEMRKSFEGLTNPSPSINESKKEESDPVVMDRKLSLWGRKLNVPESTKDVARFSFHDLCAKPLSSADYLEITRTFGTIFVEDVARMGLNEKDMARRFITFIDACYESKTRLFISSEVPIFHIFSDSDESTVKSAGDVSDHMRSIMDDLGLGVDDVKASSMFTGQEELFAFARCVSRLVQMGTKEWAETAGKL